MSNNSGSFLEQFFFNLKRGYYGLNHPTLIPVHMGLAFTFQTEDRHTNILTLPHELTGLAYVEPESVQGMAVVNVFPYYMGHILGQELSHYSDLYKPRTEDDFIKRLYESAWELHQQAMEVGGAFEDLILKMKQVSAVLRYINSVVQLPRKHMA